MTSNEEIRATPIKVQIDDGVIFRDTLGSFIDANRDADDDMIAAIEAVLDGKAYTGGGGGGVLWTVAPA